MRQGGTEYGIFGGHMEGFVGAIFILVVLAYFFKKGSGSTPKIKTTIKLNLQPPNTNVYPNPPLPTPKTSTVTNPPPGNKTPFSTTGEFKTSTEGFIPTDKCECGGQWVKHVNKTTGGRFFGCSRYPTCDNTRDKQQAKNFCSNGHERTSQNTAYNSDGSRRCLICRPLPKESPSSNFRGTNSGRTASQPSSRLTNLYCRNGHKRTTENTYVRPNGERECVICRRNARN